MRSTAHSSAIVTCGTNPYVNGRASGAAKTRSRNACTSELATERETTGLTGSNVAGGPGQRQRLAGANFNRRIDHHVDRCTALWPQRDTDDAQPPAMDVGIQVEIEPPTERLAGQDQHPEVAQPPRRLFDDRGRSGR